MNAQPTVLPNNRFTLAVRGRSVAESGPLYLSSKTMDESQLIRVLVISAFCILVVAVSCADRSLVPDRNVAHIPACPPLQTVDTRGWQLIGMPWMSLEPLAVEGWAQPLEIEFRLPGCFSEASDAELRFIHGGKIYRCGGRRVKFSYGYWGPESFEEQTPRCLTKVEGLQVIIMQTGERWYKREKVSAWYGTQGGYHLEPLIEVSSPNARDLPLLRTIAMSGRLLGTTRSGE